jgi:hypothetical protein
LTKICATCEARQSDLLRFLKTQSLSLHTLSPIRTQSETKNSRTFRELLFTGSEIVLISPPAYSPNLDLHSSTFMAALEKTQSLSAPVYIHLTINVKLFRRRDHSRSHSAAGSNIIIGDFVKLCFACSNRHSIAQTDTTTPF